MTVLPAFEQAGQSFCVPSMALILLVQVQSRVFTVKCSEPQVGISNGMDGGKVISNKGASGVDGVTVEELGGYIREN